MFHKSKSSLISTFVFVIGLTVCASTSCELPADLKSSTWTYTRPTIPPSNVKFGLMILTDFVVNVFGSNYSAFTCQLHKTLSSTKTILLFRSDTSFYDPVAGTSKRIYLCMKMTKVTSNLFYFFLLNDLLSVSNPRERATALQEPVTISDDTLESFCQYDTNNPPDDVRTLQREGTSEVLPSGITLCEPFTNTCETGSAITCDDIETVQFSTNITTGNSVNDTISFNCTTGYEITVGDSELTCSENGTWYGTTPECTIVSCSVLSVVSHSSRVPVSPTNTYDETVTYTCNTGYEKTSGDLSRKCRADKTWSGLAPVCTIISCPSLSGVLHSSKVPVSPTNTYDETVTYTCSTGYEKTSGDLSRKCRADKTWSGSVPVCTIVSCPTLAVVPNSVSNSPVPGNNYGAEISYTCISGYERKEGTLVRKCQATKQWSGSAPVCGKILCGILPNVPHSTINPNPPNTEYQSSVTYTCNTGYERASGDLTRQCQTNRQWSGVSPVCNRINCGILPVVPSVSLTITGTLYLDTVTYTCLPGYLHINGSLTRKCQADRTWDGIPPYCALLPTTPDAQTNAYVAGAVAIGSLFLIPIVVVLLLCYLRGKICKKSNAQKYNQHEWKERNQTGSSNNSYDGNYGNRGRHWLPHGQRVAYPYFSQYRY